MGQQYWTDVKEERQAELLVRDFFPWTAVDAVHVMTPSIFTRATAATQGSAHQPPIVVSREWYY
jgi:hypothetical protein